MKLYSPPNKAVFFSIIGIIVVLLVDVLLPLEVFVDTLFIIPFFIIIKESRKTLLFFTLFTLLCFVSVFLLEVSHYKNWHQYVNRFISLLAIIITSIVALMYNKLQSAHTRALEKRIELLKNILFMTSHKVRVPIANIMGLSSLLDQPVNDSDNLVLITAGMKDSALVLDKYIRELTDYVSNLKNDEK